MKKPYPEGVQAYAPYGKEPIMIGIFKNGFLWEGIIYKYDADGILLNIQGWKEGRYACDCRL